MQLTFLGTGDVRQVPVYGCDCPACSTARQDRRLRRKPCSALLELGELRILLDGGLTDLAERFAPGDLNAILLTHYHVDHVQGLFHLRWGLNDSIPVYGPDDRNGCADLLKHPGILDFRPPLTAFVPFQLDELKITPLPLQHSKPTFGYLFEHDGQHLAYLTDTVGLPEKTECFLQNFDNLEVVIDCSQPPRPEPPRNHNDLNLVIEIHTRLHSRRTWLTHIGHEMDAWLIDNGLPTGLYVAQDGQTLV
ncbi:phosphonate metabolism protein PhnP [Marinobacterium marinum]|uniref:Phosphonate metabolism protein PhnP n=1 Tax=Marinobacterium marinum TaxID=2756129 RepID=A0A7W1WVE2_9GAMM|nr:phosphonate metabolism protein PhnP [Marinobacterium marinum]MBA4500827.1 phosphonate metabolism protein PhnP [Marinobacterium marinum]